MPRTSSDVSVDDLNSKRDYHQQWLLDELSQVEKEPSEHWMISIDRTMAKFYLDLVSKKLLDDQLNGIVRLSLTMMSDWQQKIEMAGEQTFTCA